MLLMPGVHVFRDEMSCLKLTGIILLLYYCVMDFILLRTFMQTDLTQSAKSDSNELYSPFRRLTVKALMSDHASQYVVTPSAEYFDTFTHFSTIFPFITPNMISFFHLFIAAVSCRLVSSESLRTRRLGVLLFEFRTWLDSVDGVVYRSHSNTKGVFQSVRSTFGYYVDICCDLMGGIFLMFGVLFYLFKRFDPASQSQLPWKHTETGTAVNGGPGGHTVTYSKKLLFWKCLCWGFAIALAGKFWDNVIDDFKVIFQTPLQEGGPAVQTLQYETSHSVTNVVFMWVWRLVEGQALLQYILLAIFLDKIWEFLNFVQYLAPAVIISMYIISLLYARHLRVLFHL